MNLDEFTCTSHGTWYPHPAIDNNGTIAMSTNTANTTASNGTCVCDMFWINAYCSEATLAFWYPFHWTFIGLWSCTGAAQLYFVVHLIHQLLALKMSLRNVQLVICVFALGGSIGGINSSLQYMRDTWPAMRYTDLGFPSAFMTFACILTMRRIMSSAASLSASMSVFITRAERVAIGFIIVLGALTLVDIWVPEGVLAWNIIAGIFGVLILPTIYRAITLLQSLLPNTKSVESRALITRNVWLLRAILGHASALILLVACISLLGRSSETIVSWNIVYNLETIMIMSLNMELVLMAGRSVHDKSHHHHTHRMIHATSPPLQIQPSNLHSRHQSFHHSRHHSRGDALHGNGGTTSGGTTHYGHNNDGSGSDTPVGHHHNSSHRYLARALSVRVAPLPSPSLDDAIMTPSPLLAVAASPHTNNYTTSNGGGGGHAPLSSPSNNNSIAMTPSPIGAT